MLDSDSTVTICSGDHTVDDNVGWTEVLTKTKRVRDPTVEAWIPQDSKKIREQKRIHGTRSLTRLSHVTYGNETAPVGFDRKAIPHRTEELGSQISEGLMVAERFSQEI